MNASEITRIETRLPAGATSLPSPERMLGYQDKVRQVRNEQMSSLFFGLIRNLGDGVRVVRKIAKACTAARLHLRAV